MQELDDFYETAVKNGHHLVGNHIIIAEWNFNQIFDPTVTNPPDTIDWATGKQFFPPESVKDTIRPSKTGITAAFTDSAYTASEDVLAVDSVRYYTIGGDKEELYRYWICPTPSNDFVVGASGTDSDDLLEASYGVEQGTLLLEYPGYVKANKINVLFNLGPIPTDWSIYLHTEGVGGDGYVEIENPTIDVITGRTSIWWNGSAWVETQQLDEVIYSSVDKIKVEVRAVDAPLQRLQVIEISAGREVDLTARVEEWNVDYQMDDVEFVTPVGRMCSADGGITFNNYDLKINEQDPYSEFRGMLTGRCQYRVYVKYDMADYSGGEVIMRVGTLYANDWVQENEYSYEVEMWDILKLLQTKKCPAYLFENMSIARIVSQMLDMVGVDNYNLDPEDFDDSGIVKYFWITDEETIFEALDRLCQSYQSAIYVDEYGTIQLLIRSDIANEDDEPLWTFYGEKSGARLPDIESLNKKYNLQANDVTIKYKQMQAKVDELDPTSQPLTTIVWETTDSVVMRAAGLTKNLSEDGLNHLPDSIRDLWISSTAAQTWPYKGRVNVDGEIIEYDGKGYQTWDYSTTPPTPTEILVHNDDERRKADRTTWNTFPSDGLLSPGGTSIDAKQQNQYTGRLFITKRDANNSGRQAYHSTWWRPGWMGMKAWLKTTPNPSFPGRYIEPGLSSYNQAHLQDYKNRINWNSYQTRWTVSNSVLKCDNTSNGGWDPNIFIRDLGDTEYREFGTRIRLGGKGYGGLIFYLSNSTNGYQQEDILTDPLLATRWYQVTLIPSEEVEAAGRAHNEVYVEVKNGPNMTPLVSIKGDNGKVIGSGGKWNIERGKWYDLDVVVKDGGDENNQGILNASTQIEVYIDGQWVDTFGTTDNIRGGGLAGIHARWASVIEFEHFYASTTSLNSRPGYKDDDKFDFQTFTLPAGTNKSTILNLPTSEAEGESQAVLALSTTGSAVTVSSLKVKGGFVPGWSKTAAGDGQSLSKVQELGPITIKPNTRVYIDFDEAVSYATAAEITYTSAQDLSVCWESTSYRNFPYGLDTYITPPVNGYYDEAKGGYLSSRNDEYLYINPIYPNYWKDAQSNYESRQLFADDFGATIHEIRDFEVDYDVMPAKGVRVYCSNQKVRVLDQYYNPAKGIFTLVNASHKDEIVNGNEEIDESNSIDHTLMLYGYALEDKGDKTKQVKDESSIRRHGSVAIDINAEWVFNEEEAEALGNWIVEHWADPMDTIELEVFSNTFTQIGDKVNVVYSNANIEEDWLYIVSDKHVAFDDTGLSTTVTLRRVR
jgi:hypothetical protein